MNAFRDRVRLPCVSLNGRPTRRRFAGALAAVLGGGLAGCTGDADELGDGHSSPPEDTPIGRECERDHQKLPDLVLHNEDGERHTVEVTVTGEREDSSTEPFFEDSFDLRGGRRFVRAVAFDPDPDDIERYENFVASVTTEEGSSDTESVYATVVGLPLRYGLVVQVDSKGRVRVDERHVDTGSDWEPVC